MPKQEFLAPMFHGIPPVPLSVPDVEVHYSDSFVLTRKNFFGVEVQFSSDTDVNVKVELEQSNYRETTPNIADSNFVVAIDTLATIIDENVHLLPVAPVVAVYARLKFTGLATGLANSATTVLTRANWVEVES
jgi:hypothetical protein